MLLLADYSGLYVDGLVVHKEDEERGFTTVKYHNKVFYKNLWHTDDLLLEARGMVFESETGDIVNRPFKKVFNLGEKGAPRLSDLVKYNLHQKINGFMVAVSSHKGELVVSTTGTTTSEYAKLAESWVMSRSSIVETLHSMPSYTFIFECCDPSDPHIIEEGYGLYLLGVREKTTGDLLPLNVVEVIARNMCVLFPVVIPRCSRKEVLDIVQDDTSEGYMVYEEGSSEPLVKMKSPYYLSRKALARLSKRKLKEIKETPEKFKERLDEEFYDLFDHIVEYGVDFFFDMNEQERLDYMNRYFDWRED